MSEMERKELPHRPELLAPAGDWDCLRAAIENGADAVYFGLECGFNARVRAANFAVAELPEIISQLHHRGVRGYVTLNTLVFTDELTAMEKLVQQVAAAGADAILVQDLGLVRLVREVCPDLPIHASTQMTLTSAECIQAVESLGIERVVLARELSLDEIRAIHAQTAMPLEVFVHGALCVAYSGQCLTSESLGGRSANRGQCAQACRLPYDLICDGEQVELGRVKYLLSPQDLAAHALVPELVAAGVAALKIEGRLKTAEYVANITRHYRDLIDAACQGQQRTLSPVALREMELSFSRGFSPGWLQGCDHKMLVPGLSSAKRGVQLGRVVEVRRDRVAVKLDAPVAAGDGIVFDGDRARGNEQGGRIFTVWQRGQRVDGEAAEGVVELGFARDGVDLATLYPGQLVWKTDDPRLTARLRATFRAADPIRRVPLTIEIVARSGEPLRLVAQTESGAHCQLSSEEPLVAARKHPLTEELLREQFGRLGGTNYILGGLRAQIAGTPMVPLSVLGRLRRELVERLDASIQPPLRRIATESVVLALRGSAHSAESSAEHDSNPPSSLWVLCRTLDQLEGALECQPGGVYVDFQDIREYRAAVERAQGAGRQADLFLATPRIQKPGEMGVFRAMAKHRPGGFLARNLAALEFCRTQALPYVVDFSLNTANELTYQEFVRRGATRITPSYDLNRDQLLALVDQVPPGAMEIVIHQHMPMFHMEHCVFCAVLSPGTNKTNCGRPCDVHRVQLRDRIGVEHPLLADVGCRNTLFNAVPQSAAEAVPDLQRRGLACFRIELLNESREQVSVIYSLYRELLDGRRSGKDVWKQLQASNRVGVTRGTLEERRNPLAIL